MSKWKFSEKNPIAILGFLTKLVKEADILGMSEAQALLGVSYVMSGTAQTTFEAVRDSPSEGRHGVTTWPEAVYYLFAHYCTTENISRVEADLGNLRQRLGEDELDFSNRVDEACRQLGHVYSLDDKATVFVNGLDESIKPIIEEYRNDHENVSYLKLVQKAQVEGKTARARSQVRRPQGVSAPGSLRKSPSRTMLMEQSSPADSPYIPYAPSSNGDDQDALLHAHVVPFQGFSGSEEAARPVPWELTTTPSHSSESNPALMMYGRPKHWNPALRIPAADGNRYFQAMRPGCPTPPALPPTPAFDGLTARGNPGTSNGLVCHIFFCRRHVSRECTLPARDHRMVVRNYEALTEGERARVPMDSHLRARAQFFTNDKFLDLTDSSQQEEQKGLPQVPGVRHILTAPPRSPNIRPGTPTRPQSPQKN